MSSDQENKVLEPEETQNVQEEAEEQSPETVQENPLQKSYDELYDKHLRTLAEYENYKKRTQKEKEELFTYAQAVAITELLPVLDNLERAADAAEDSPLAEGVQMVLKQLLEILSKLGVSETPAVGEPFDPQVHNAVMHVEDESLGENVVAEQFVKGYKMKDKVIRHSMVKVAN